MSTIITKYYSKIEALEALKTEIEQMENSEELKEELKFKSEIEKLMDKHSIDTRGVLKVLEGIDPHLHSKGSTGPRKARPLMQYTNPESGEVVKTRGANHKTLKEWREKYGADVVDSWKKKV